MGKSEKEVPEWARSIIVHALGKIKRREDISKVVEEVKGTALGVRPDLMKIFLELVELKSKTLRD